MKTVLAFWAATLAIVSGLLFWRNKRRYPDHTYGWMIIKSVIETFILTISALRLPALLCAWISLWLTKPIKQTWMRVTIGVFIGIGLALLSAYALEFVLLLSVFSIDNITGEEEGFLHNFMKAKKLDDRRTELARAA